MIYVDLSDWQKVEGYCEIYLKAAHHIQKWDASFRGLVQNITIILLVSQFMQEEYQEFGERLRLFIIEFHQDASGKDTLPEMAMRFAYASISMLMGKGPELLSRLIEIVKTKSESCEDEYNDYGIKIAKTIEILRGPGDDGAV